ncbi:MAG: YbfB/YjiJ family MFS transporter, partial [Siculibacillus sp.]
MTRGERLATLGRGAATLMLAMGLGRFAFTALLPEMQAAARFSDAEAGLMASLNLAAYLGGVIWAGRARPEARASLLRLALGGAVVAIAAMGLPLGVLGWDAVRILAGATSGLLFVLATAFVLESGAALGPSGAALHFAGVDVDPSAEARPDRRGDQL